MGSKFTGSKVQEKGTKKGGLEIVDSQSFLGAKSADCFSFETFSLGTREVAWSMSQVMPPHSLPKVYGVPNNTPDHSPASGSFSLSYFLILEEKQPADFIYL